jgi:hypothetical protein
MSCRVIFLLQPSFAREMWCSFWTEGSGSYTDRPWLNTTYKLRAQVSKLHVTHDVTLTHFCVLSTPRLCIFLRFFKVNSDYFPIQEKPIGLYNVQSAFSVRYDLNSYIQFAWTSVLRALGSNVCLALRRQDCRPSQCQTVSDSVRHIFP